MCKWFDVSYNNGHKAVRAKTEAVAIEKYCTFGGCLNILPGMTATEITADKAEEYFFKIR